jgi:hypothetical protein
VIVEKTEGKRPLEEPGIDERRRLKGPERNRVRVYGLDSYGSG